MYVAHIIDCNLFYCKQMIHRTKFLITDVVHSNSDSFRSQLYCFCTVTYTFICIVLGYYAVINNHNLEIFSFCFTKKKKKIFFIMKTRFAQGRKCIKPVDFWTDFAFQFLLFVFLFSVSK